MKTNGSADLAAPTCMADDPKLKIPFSRGIFIAFAPNTYDFERNIVKSKDSTSCWSRVAACL